MKVALLLVCLTILLSCSPTKENLAGDSTQQDLADDSTSMTRPADYQLVFSDEFEQEGAPNPTFWSYDIGSPLLGGTVWGNNENQYYTESNRNIRIQDGKLLIQPYYGGLPIANLPEGVTSSMVFATSARLKSDTAAFYAAINDSPYGYYEIRAKVNCTRGSWPAIWLMGRNFAWPDRGEIDLMEWFGRYFYPTRTDTIFQGVHTRANHAENNIGKESRLNLCGQFVRYQMHHLHDRLLLGFNDKIGFVYTKPSNANNDNWPFNQAQHLLLNVAVGGNLGGELNPNSSSDTDLIQEMSMQVDYVKIWQPAP